MWKSTLDIISRLERSGSLMTMAEQRFFFVSLTNFLCLVSKMCKHLPRYTSFIFSFLVKVRSFVQAATKYYAKRRNTPLVSWPWFKLKGKNLYGNHDKHNIMVYLACPVHLKDDFGFIMSEWHIEKMWFLPLFKNFGIIRTRLAVRLTVGQRTLNPYVEVRILYRQLIP